MKSRIAMVFCLIVGGVSLLYAHDLFLKLDSYFLHPDTPVRISVLNGTFTSTEAVPLQNPYALGVGSELSVRCLVDGRPVANQAVMAGGEYHGAPIEEQMVRTDQYGVALITLDSPGKWYVKFINMVEVADDDLDYESKWATLTFEVR